MRPLRSLHNKGFESVLTTLLFITVVTAIFLSIYYLNVTLTNMRATASDELNVHVVSENARNRLLHCYGEHLENLSNPCIVNGISGYNISQESYGLCNHKLLKSEGSFETKNTMVHFAPAYNQELDRQCLGKIIIYI